MVLRRIGEPVQSDTELLARLRRAGIGPGTPVLVSRAGGRVQVGTGQHWIDIGDTAAAHIFVTASSDTRAVACPEPALVASHPPRGQEKEC